ncbi:DUF2958 domain-containing protein [Sphingomonas sp. DT-204]|uniref:DUF2958 domain-containing protein n=1 Tax=Sphingomonas sp. DT-204 TaxID=3396166 RepID=UPI003F1AF296
MMLLTPELRTMLRANAERTAAHSAFNPLPVVKFFNPIGAATWLATELYPNDDTLFGLADLGFGTPELGTFSLSELVSVRLPWGIRLERDISFLGLAPLSIWATTARACGSIIAAEALLLDLHLGRPADTELPPH